MKVAPGILLVEDQADDAFLLQRAFRKANLATPIQIVTDGEEAVAYLAGNEAYADRDRYPLPVLMLLDVKLPRKSGHEVLEWLRRQPGLKRLPVVMLTSSRQAADINRAYDLNANSYLTKPVDFDTLVDMVKTLSMYWFTLNEKPQVQVE